MTASISINSYLDITAITAITPGKIDVRKSYLAVIIACLHHHAFSPVRLEGQISARMVARNNEITALEQQRQSLMRQVNSLMLALAELKNSPAKNLTEEQYQQRMILSQQLAKDLETSKRILLDIDKQLVYWHDHQEDLQNTMRVKFSQTLNTIDNINQQKVAMIIDYLKKLNINTDQPELAENLLKALNDPLVQAAFMAEAKAKPNKGFTQKLKDWFK